MLDSLELLFLAVVLVMLTFAIRSVIGARKKNSHVRRTSRSVTKADVWDSAATRRRNAP